LEGAVDLHVQGGVLGDTVTFRYSRLSAYLAEDLGLEIPLIHHTFGGGWLAVTAVYIIHYHNNYLPNLELWTLRNPHT